MEYKQADFAKAYGLEPSTVSKALKRGALQKNTAGLLDDDNILNKTFLTKYRLKTNKDVPPDKSQTGKLASTQVDFSVFDEYEITEHAGLPRKLLGMTIRDLVLKFKGLDGIERYVKMLRDLLAGDEKDQKVQERRLQLVEKDFIIAHVFSYLDGLMKQLLEWPAGAVDGIIALVQSEGAAARKDVSRVMEKGVTDIIKDAKNHIIKELSGLRAKYQEDEDEKISEIKEAVEILVDQKQAAKQ